MVHFHTNGVHDRRSVNIQKDWKNWSDSNNALFSQIETRSKVGHRKIVNSNLRHLSFETT